MVMPKSQLEKAYNIGVSTPGGAKKERMLKHQENFQEHTSHNHLMKRICSSSKIIISNAYLTRKKKKKKGRKKKGKRKKKDE